MITEFTSDGRLISDEFDIEITYTIDEDTLNMSMMGMDFPMRFTLDGDTLQITDPGTGDIQTLTRVR